MMRSTTTLLALGLASATAVLPTSRASAQVTGIVTDRQIINLSGRQNFINAPTQTITMQNVTIPDGSVQNNFSTRLPGGQTRDPLYSVTNYQVATGIDNAAGHVSFAANATASGNYAQSSVGTTVDVTYRNGGGTTVPVTLASTIIPAGFGIYVADPTRNEMGGDINHHPESRYITFLDMARGVTASATQTSIATSKVSFQILSGTTTVASYTASLDMFLTPDGTGGYGGIDPVMASDGWVLDASGARQTLTLANFGLIDADDANKAVGYRWDATDVLVPLGDIAAGETRTLTYLTSVETAVLSPGLGYNIGQLLAYAGFGDPIGQHAGGGGIADPDFPLLNLSLPTFGQGEASLTLSSAKFTGYSDAPLPLRQVDGLASAVPEPTSWATMLGGLGLVGGAMRRRPRRSRAHHLA